MALDDCHFIPWALIGFFVLAFLCLVVAGRRKTYAFYRKAEG